MNEFTTGRRNGFHSTLVIYACFEYASKRLWAVNYLYEPMTAKAMADTCSAVTNYRQT